MTQQQLDAAYQALLDREAQESIPNYDTPILPLPRKPKVMGQGNPYENGNLIRTILAENKTLLHPYQFTQLVNLIRTGNIVTNNFRLFAADLKKIINQRFPQVRYFKFSDLTQEQRNILRGMILANYRSGGHTDKKHE
jgi:hypothetical protein